MKFIRFFPVFLILSALLTAGDQAKSIQITNDEVYQEDITAINRDVWIEGKLDASLFQVGGNLHLKGEVKGDIICFFVKLEIDETARIGKDLIVLGGDLNISKEASVSGRISHIRNMDDFRQLSIEMLPFIPDSGDTSIFKIIKIIFWFILCLIILAIIPERIENASRLYPLPTLKTGFTGFLIYLFFLILLVLFLILSLFLIGIPFLLSLLILFFLAQATGRTILFYAWGKGLAQLMHLHRAKPTTFILLGILPYFAFKFTPFIGIILLLAMDCLALGISYFFFFKRKRKA